MRLNIAHKIFGVALVVLVLMATVAFFSVRFTAKISDELELVATKQLPLSDTIGELNVRILEQGVLMQRLFVLSDDKRTDINRILDLSDQIGREFEVAFELLNAEKHEPDLSASINNLEGALRIVELEYRKYEKTGFDLLTLHINDDVRAFDALLPDYVRLQNAVDAEVDRLRELVEDTAGLAVGRADDNEKFLLQFNASMTALSAVLGLSIAGLVTFFLVRNIRNLVRGADEIGDGNLDVEVPVASRDEVGHLTHSFNHMAGELRLKERIKDTFGKYMDPRIVTRLIENPELTQLGGERQEMTVMFVDLQGYTTISEKLSPADLVRMLNMFLGQMTDAVAKHNGVINDFLGDAVMAYWGPPFNTPDEHARLACLAGVSALENFEHYKAEIAKELGAELDGLDINMRIGIATGSVVAGNIGSPASRKFSLIGDSVNLAARLEGANKNYGTRAMISERTRELAGSAVSVRELDLVRVKGKLEPTRIYELLRPGSKKPNLDAGLKAYRSQDWATAEHAFESCKQIAADDSVPAVFLNRIQHFRNQSPGGGWDGVWEFQTK